MNWIEASCRTNLDDYDCSLVTRFAAIPNKGDMVQVIYKGNVSSLEVVRITHKCRNQSQNPTPYIEVELHKSR